MSGILNDSINCSPTLELAPLLSPYPFPIPGIIYPSRYGNARNPQRVAQLVQQKIKLPIH